MRFAWSRLSLFAAGLIALGSSLVRADDRIVDRETFSPPQVRDWSDKDFVRVRRDGSGIIVGVDTACVCFRGIPTVDRADSPASSPDKPLPAQEVQVDLIGVIHVADPDYFRFLNTCLVQYDAVLYELVAPPEARTAPGEAPWDWSVLGITQRVGAGVLGLQFQLDGINYKASNFVHADMTPEQFADSMRRRGESWGQMLLRSLREVFRAPPPQEADLRELWSALRLRGIERQIALRRWLAGGLADWQRSARVFEGPEGSTIITERNKVALAVLKEQLAEGRQKLAIFYGAAHMPDLAERLQSELGLKACERQWLVAWDLRDPSTAGVEAK